MRKSRKQFLRLLSVSTLFCALLASPFAKTQAVTSPDDLILITGFSAPSSVELGKNFTFTLSCKNNSGATINQFHVNITAFVEGQFNRETFIPISSSGGTIVSPAPEQGDWAVMTGNASAGQTVTVKVTMKPTGAVGVGEEALLNAECAGYQDGEYVFSQGMIIYHIAITEPAPEPEPTPEEPDDSSKTQKNEQPKVEPKLSGVSLPDIFNKQDSKTTNLSGLSDAEAKSYEGFTLEDTSTGKIVFLEPIDLTDQSLLDKYADFAEYIIIKNGVVEVNSTELSLLNVRSTVTLYGLNLASNQIQILRDGEDSSDYVSDINYDQETNALTFTATGFSRYEVAPGLSIDESTLETKSTDQESFSLKGSVGDLTATIKVLLNGDEIQEGIAIDESGAFEVNLLFKEGENTVEVIATSQNGVEERQTLEVEYAKKSIDQKDGTGIPVWVIWVSGGSGIVLIAVLVFVEVRYNSLSGFVRKIRGKIKK